MCEEKGLRRWLSNRRASKPFRLRTLSPASPLSGKRLSRSRTLFVTRCGATGRSLVAELIMFPQARNVGKARHVAKLYRGKASPKERETYWRMVVNRLAAGMAKSGFSQSAINQQVGNFRNAVQDQLDALSN